MPVQWAQLGVGQTLVASSRGAWMQPPGLSAFGLHGDMPESAEANVETTRHLLDGAIAAAERAAPGSAPPISERRWAWSLIGQWACAHHSVALLPELIERYELIGRPDLARFARLKLEEEQGHDAFPLADLDALGYDALALVAEVEPAPSVRGLLDYAQAHARDEEPVEFIGYMYALERRVLRCSPEWFARLEAALPPGIEAASGVRAHANDLDAGHVDEAVLFITGLGAGDRTRIALGAYRTTQISCSALPGEHPSEGELEARMARFQWRPSNRP